MTLSRPTLEVSSGTRGVASAASGSMNVTMVEKCMMKKVVDEYEKSSKI